MPRYLVQHLTRYNYEELVSVCHHLAHLLPRESAFHTWLSAEVTIDPVPAFRADRLDYFGNRVTFFAIQEAHRELSVWSQGLVDLRPPPEASLLFASPAWETVRDQFAHPEKVAPLPAVKLSACQFVQPSPYIAWTREIAEFAALSFTSGRPILQSAMDLMARIHGEFVYDRTCTTVATTLPEVLAKKAGVCQDFAHFLIGALRSHGLPARYVSGYLLTMPPAGSPRLVGADASHAWVSFFLPGDDGGSWIDLDPTNNVIPSDKHITLAWGRDFGDVSPLRGVILGGGRHQVQVQVDVAPA